MDTTVEKHIETTTDRLTTDRLTPEKRAVIAKQLQALMAELQPYPASLIISGGITESQLGIVTNIAK